MPILKKLIFAPVFLIFLAFLIFQLNSYFYNFEFIFSLSLDNLYQFIWLAILILLTSLAFTLFATFAFDWRFVVPVIILGSILSLFFTAPTLGVVLTAGFLISLLIVYYKLDNSLKTYITFHPFHLFGPSIRNLSFLLILTFSIVYYFSVNLIIQRDGFQIPDSLIKTTLKFIPKPQKEESKTQPQITIPKEQIELLKENPALLKQYGLDPKILDTLDKSQNTPENEAISDEFLKLALKDQLDKIIKPYLDYIPISLALLFFITIQAITSFLNILIYPLLWIIFFLLEKSGFVQFTTEMRPVKKMVV